MKRSEPVQPSGERLQKIIASAGLASRREAEGWIREGRVSLNGRVVRELGTRADPSRDTIRLDGRRLGRPERRIALLLNKPRGFLSTCSDPEKRPTVMSLIAGVRERVYPVGRLDFASEGLLILTNDGELAMAVTHPRNQCRKVYRVKVRGIPSDEALHRIARGVVLEGRKTLPAHVSRVRSESNAWLEVTLTEGRKNQIRKVFEKMGYPVLKLKRIAIGGIGDRGLAPGAWRKLTDAEIRSLKGASR
ncbi:MAG TPA: pseudouridine synthase [Candidatus Polarisedimenticolia bacterium]|jgi:pseudouridine synthase|nr:pseudouridine synthase [Candidatus Polarisedimenticolia bacterium]